MQSAGHSHKQVVRRTHKHFERLISFVVDWKSKRLCWCPVGPCTHSICHTVAKSTVNMIIDHQSFSLSLSLSLSLCLSLTFHDCVKNVWEVARSTRTYGREAVRRAAIIVLRDKPKWAAFKTECSLGYCRQTVAGQTCRWLSLPFVVVGRWDFCVWQSALHSPLMIHHDIVWLFTLSWQKNHFDLYTKKHSRYCVASSIIRLQEIHFHFPSTVFSLSEILCTISNTHDCRINWLLMKWVFCKSAQLFGSLKVWRMEKGRAKSFQETWWVWKRLQDKGKGKDVTEIQERQEVKRNPKRKTEWDGWLWW